MTTRATAVFNELVSSSMDFRLARSPSIEVRWRLKQAREAASDRTVLTDDQYNAALSRAAEFSRAI